MDTIDWNKLQEQALHFVTTPSIALYITLGIVALFLMSLLVNTINRTSRKKRIKRSAPKLILEGFQVSPMGHDAYLKLRNEGNPATLSLLDIKGRHDLLIRNQLAGHKVDKEAPYRILLESSGAKKIDANFKLCLTFLDERGNVFRQEFNPATSASQPPKLLRIG